MTDLPLARRAVLAAPLLLTGLARPARAANEGASGPDQKRTILVVGDSQAQGLASGMQRWSRPAGWAHVINGAKPGTGLIAPATFDWPAAIPGLIAPPPDAAVMMFGANDRLPIRVQDGASLPFNSDAWNTVYRERVTRMVHAIRAAGVPVLWVGNPIAREEKYSRDMRTLNAIFAEIVGAEGGTYLDIWLAVSEDGRYAAHGPTLAGATARMRLDDGIHFTPDGYDVVAARVMRAVGDVLAIPAKA